MKQESNVAGFRLLKSPAATVALQIACLGFLGGLGFIPRTGSDCLVSQDFLALPAWLASSSRFTVSDTKTDFVAAQAARY